MKAIAVPMFTMPQVISSSPQLTSSPTREESEVTRDMIQPTGVRSKYENDRSCRWLNIFWRRSYWMRSPRMPHK